MKNLLNKIFFPGLSIFLIVVLLSACSRDKKEPGLPITTRAEADKKIAAIGDKIKYRIIIQKDKDIEIEPFVFGRNLGNFAIKDFGSKRSAFFNKEKITQWYILDTYITGKTVIPKATIKYRKNKDKNWSQIEADEIEIEVKSVLDKAGKIIQMRDIKGPVGLPSEIIKFLIPISVLFLAVLGLLAWYFLKKNKQAQYTLKKPAHEIAYEQLEALRLKDYIGRGLIKEYYTEVSDIIRHYLENRFRLKAPDMTTEEFLVSARDASELISEHKNLLKEFLLYCDLVKFAKYAPSADEINSIFDSAKHFIEQTKENEPA
jgi:nitrogen fixation-related uncharacterized protein